MWTREIYVAARVLLDLEQAPFADLAGVSRSTVQRVERDPIGNPKGAEKVRAAMEAAGIRVAFGGETVVLSLDKAAKDRWMREAEAKIAHKASSSD